MPHYVLLMRDHSTGLKAIREDPTVLEGVRDALERWEAKILHSYRLMGIWDQVYVVDAPDNFKAYRATLAQEMGTTADTEILPAIDLPLFQRLLSQTTATEGPHQWQIQWWARIARVAMYPYAYDRWARRYFTEHKVHGAEKWASVQAPCIVVANHASHFDQYCLMKAVPWRIRSNLFFGAAADRWFLKGRKEVTLRPWYQSLVNGAYPIHRGGGSKTLEYPAWLLEHGANLMLFPEGTRARGRALSKFKHGAAILAEKAGVPVVPVYLEGLQAIRPPGTKEAKPGPVAAHVLDPVHPQGLSVPQITNAVYQQMKSTHEAAMARRYGADAMKNADSN